MPTIHNYRKPAKPAKWGVSESGTMKHVQPKKTYSVQFRAILAQ